MALKTGGYRDYMRAPVIGKYECIEQALFKL